MGGSQRFSLGGQGGLSPSHLPCQRTLATRHWHVTTPGDASSMAVLVFPWFLLNARLTLTRRDDRACATGMPNAIGSAQSSPYFNVSHEGLTVSLGLPNQVFEAIDRRSTETSC